MGNKSKEELCFGYGLSCFINPICWVMYGIFCIQDYAKGQLNEKESK